MTTARHQNTLEQLKPGDHLCCLYETEEEHRALLAPFLRQGLEQGQKVVYIAEQHRPEQILNYLREDGCSVDSYLASAQLSVISPAEAYLRGGGFDPDRMIAFLRAETERTLTQGCPALRVTGEMTWSLQGLPGSERLIEYEAKLNHFIPGSACLAICRYNRQRFPPELLQDVLATHPMAVVGTTIYDNFYYIPPEKFLGPNSEQAVLSCSLENLAERNRVEEELRRSRDEWELTFDLLSDGITVHDPEYNVIRGNQAFAKLIGTDSIEGLKCYKLVHGLDGPPSYCPLAKTLTTRKSVSYDFFEPHLSRHLAIRTDPVFAGNGEVSRIIHIVRDITENKRAEQELGKTNTALQSANKELEAFVYAVAHDLRAPLRQIGGFSNILMQEYGPKVDPNARRYLELIQFGTQRMTYLLEDLLNLFRIGW